MQPSGSSLGVVGPNCAVQTGGNSLADAFGTLVGNTAHEELVKHVHTIGTVISLVSVSRWTWTVMQRLAGCV